MIITGVIGAVTAMIIGTKTTGSVMITGTKVAGDVMITRAEAIGVVIIHNQDKTVDSNLIKTTMVMIEVTSHNRQIITEETVTGATMVAAVNLLKLQTQDKAALPVQDYKFPLP
jgi:hypothetical protein